MDICGCLVLVGWALSKRQRLQFQEVRERTLCGSLRAATIYVDSRFFGAFGFFLFFSPSFPFFPLSFCALFVFLRKAHLFNAKFSPSDPKCTNTIRLEREAGAFQVMEADHSPSVLRSDPRWTGVLLNRTITTLTQNAKRNKKTLPLDTIETNNSFVFLHKNRPEMRANWCKCKVLYTFHVAFCVFAWEVPKIPGFSGCGELPLPPSLSWDGFADQYLYTVLVLLITNLSQSCETAQFAFYPCQLWSVQSPPSCFRRRGYRGQGIAILFPIPFSFAMGVHTGTTMEFTPWRSVLQSFIPVSCEAFSPRPVSFCGGHRKWLQAWGPIHTGRAVQRIEKVPPLLGAACSVDNTVAAMSSRLFLSMRKSTCGVCKKCIWRAGPVRVLCIRSHPHKTQEVNKWSQVPFWRMLHHTLLDLSRLGFSHPSLLCFSRRVQCGRGPILFLFNIMWSKQLHNRGFSQRAWTGKESALREKCVQSLWLFNGFVYTTSILTAATVGVFSKQPDPHPPELGQGSKGQNTDFRVLPLWTKILDPHLCSLWALSLEPIVFHE